MPWEQTKSLKTDKKERKREKIVNDNFKYCLHRIRNGKKGNQWLSPKYVNCGVIFCHDLLKCHADILSSWFFVKHKPVKQIVLVKKGKTEKS